MILPAKSGRAAMQPGLVGAMLFACSSDPRTGYLHYRVCIVTQPIKTLLFLEEVAKAGKAQILGRRIYAALFGASCSCTRLRHVL